MATAVSPGPSIPQTKQNGGSGTTALNYNNIRLNASGDIGQFRAMNEKFGWRVRKAAIGGDAAAKRTVQYDATQITACFWICVMQKEHQLKVVLNDGETIRFDGFRESDFSAIQKHVKLHWGVELNKAKVATRGWNWGEGKINGKTFDFYVENRTAFQLPPQKITQVSAAKGDVTLVLEGDEERGDAEDQLIEMRIYVPPPKTGDKDPTDEWKESFLSIAGSKVTSSLSICTITDVKVIVPAGRYDLVFSKKALKLQGKSNDFTIDFKNILKSVDSLQFDAEQLPLVMSLASPLRKGRTIYPNVVIQFDDKKVIDIELGIEQKEIDEIEAANSSSLNTKLETTMSGVVYDLASRILKCFSGKQMIVPGDFRSAFGLPCFKTSYKAETGNFYPLNQSLIFIPKPVIIIKYDDIASVTFGRTSGSQTKFFEFDVLMKSGQTFSFSSVDRHETGPFTDFLASRGVRIPPTPDETSNQAEHHQSILGRDLLSESDDEDFEAGESSEDDDSEDDDDDDDKVEDVEQPKAQKRKHNDSEGSPTKKAKMKSKTKKESS